MQLESQNNRETLTSDEKKQLQLQYTGNWVWRAIAALVETRDFCHSVKWIADRLSVTVEEVVFALEGLEALGIIRRTSNGYEKVLKYIYYTDRDLDSTAILKDHVLVSTQILGRLATKSVVRPSFYRTAFYASTIEQARAFFLRIEDLMKQFMVDSASQASDRVFAVTLSGVDLTTKRGGTHEN